MNLFEAVKASVTTKQAAERYGVEVDRAGKACCIFHDDRHPSMKVDDRYHCFSCGADGDVIDFTAQLFGIGLREAAERLASDFGIAYDREFTRSAAVRKNPVKGSLLRRLRTYQNENYRALCSYFHLLRQWEAEYSPSRSDERNGIPCSWKPSKTAPGWSTCWTSCKDARRRKRGRSSPKTRMKLPVTPAV